MKNGQNLRDLQAQKAKKTEELWIKQPVCMVCNKETMGYYARYGDSGVCGSACMRVQAKVYAFPGHTETDFLKRQGAYDDSLPRKTEAETGGDED